MTEPVVGIHPGMSRAVYESIDAANFSMLKHFARSAAHARHYMVSPPEPTPALVLGTQLHAAILEPEAFEKAYAGAPDCDRRTKEGRATWAAAQEANAGKELVKANDWAFIMTARDAAWKDPRLAALLRAPGLNEVAIVWQHERTGLYCKAMLDRLTQYDGWTWIVDVKSCVDASPGPFAAACARGLYHAQGAHYLAGCNAIAPARRRFGWVAFEKEPPHLAARYEPDDAALVAGEALIEKWLDQYAECRETDVWPGYSQKIERLELPRWALREGDVV